MSNSGKRQVGGLGAIVVKARGDRKQQDFARQLKISPRTLGEIERESTATLASIIKLHSQIPSIVNSPSVIQAYPELGENETFEELKRLASLNLSSSIESGSLGHLSQVQVQQLLLEVNEAIMTAYLRLGNPLVFFNVGEPWLAAAFNSEGANTYEVALLSLNLGYLLVQADYDSDLIAQAIQRFDDTIRLLSKMSLLTNDGFKNLNKAHWLKSVALKLQGYDDDALSELDAALSDKALTKRSNPVSTAPLLRQQVLIRQTKNEFERLESSMRDYAIDPIELFHTTRRLWEFALNEREQSKASEFYEKTNAIYVQIKRYLEPIYRLTFNRTRLFHFLSRREFSAAERLKNQLIRQCETLQLYGQERQINSLWEASRSMNHGQFRLKSAKSIKHE